MSHEFVMKPLSTHVKIKDTHSNEILEIPPPPEMNARQPDGVSPSIAIVQEIFAKFLQMAELKIDKVLYKSLVKHPLYYITFRMSSRIYQWNLGKETIHLSIDF